MTDTPGALNDDAGQTGQTEVTQAAPDAAQQQPVQDDAPTDAAQHRDHTDSTPNSREARYRVERNQARQERDQMQQERDQARDQATALRQSIIDEIATAAGLRDPGLLTREGPPQNELLSEKGVPDAKKVGEACAVLIDKHGIGAIGLTPNPQQGNFGGPARPSPSQQWAGAFAPSRAVR